MVTISSFSSLFHPNGLGTPIFLKRFFGRRKWISNPFTEYPLHFKASLVSARTATRAKYFPPRIKLDSFSLQIFWLYTVIQYSRLHCFLYITVHSLFGNTSTNKGKILPTSWLCNSRVWTLILFCPLIFLLNCSF